MGNGAMGDVVKVQMMLNNGFQTMLNVLHVIVIFGIHTLCCYDIVDVAAVLHLQ
jgi:hypothetical protein